MLAAPLACTPGDRHDRVERQRVAIVDAPTGELELDARVVERIAERDGVDAETARARALETLILVADRRAEIAERGGGPDDPDDLDPLRREHLERAAMVRLWLDERFEPTHREADIPQRVVNANMEDPRIFQRLFHPELFSICQVLIVPVDPHKAADEPTGVPGTELAGGDIDPALAERWYATAGQTFAPMVERIQRAGDELIEEQRGCGLFLRLIGASDHEFSTELGDMRIRSERFAFAPALSDNFDQSWVERVTAQEEPGLIGPFETEFGIHLVLLNEVLPASLEDGSMAPDALRTAREQRLREELEMSWRAEQLQLTLEEIRERRVIRLAPELEQGP
ncbi:hypothetical protein G6O69_30485 [Pseudenhygromyxa sp. WMMC2535]|uniref:hypothetical protein n=1 Tax=Pseudenhygromyxa sp. WMMC2535 TaxID=2712867 RepID=UPI001557D083|nr:hypothetical protein [Pseudenhygromyxa sp. WMMC2535]NVB42190.1 hypothetical protein [Pseudenhygromyxa sp. WMMC2535]